jgi:hypothetical protein
MIKYRTPWEHEEDVALRQMILSGKTHQQIAKALERTVKSVSDRSGRIGLRGYYKRNSRPKTPVEIPKEEPVAAPVLGKDLDPWAIWDRANRSLRRSTCAS